LLNNSELVYIETSEADAKIIILPWFFVMIALKFMNKFYHNTFVKNQKCY
jgi:hypothetical protein